MKRWRWRLGALLAVVVAAAAAAVGTMASRTATTKIVVWDWGSPPPSAFKALDTAYMKSHPGVEIDRVHQPFNSFFTLMRTAIATHKGPDIFENSASPFIFDYYQGLMPLDKLASQADRKNLIGWNYVSSNLSNSGTPYALPWSGQGIHFYYERYLTNRLRETFGFDGVPLRFRFRKKGRSE